MRSASETLVMRLRSAGCVFAEEEAGLLTAVARTTAQLDAMTDRRVAGQPLEHILGWVDFCGLRLVVEPGVFVPRRRTEFLVEQAARLDRQSHHSTVVVDLCCGSGAVGAALAVAAGPVELYAVDTEPAAARCARTNLATAGGHVYEGDLFEPLPETLRGCVDVLVANVPYVPTAEIAQMPPEARLHEPRVALDGGADGLDVLRRVAAEASVWLAVSGRLLVETSRRQAPELVDICLRSGLDPRVVRSEASDATVVVAAPSPPPGRHAGRLS